MKIRELAIRRFRSVFEIRIQCDRMTALLGPNGAGKSNILAALERFYSPSPKIDEHDFFRRNTKHDIQIQITFDDLSPREAELFSPYIDRETLTVTRVFKSDGTNKYHGSKLQNPEFELVRNISAGRAKIQAYNELREKKEYAHLPAARGANAVEENFLKWESENPDKLRRTLDQGQFFGFRNVGSGNLDKWTNFLFIPAVRDASEDVSEGRESPITRLMDLIVRNSLASREDIASLKRKTLEEYIRLTDPNHLPQLGELSGELTDSLGQLYPGRSVELDWLDIADFTLPPPKAEVWIREDGYPTRVGHVGHGLQRAFIITLLQHLALADTAHRLLARTAEEPESPPEVKTIEAELDEQNLPSLILAIEEPELYQHPNQQRHFASVLTQLSDGDISGVAKNTQVIISTHSPHFVSLQRSKQVRLVSKREDEAANAPSTFCVRCDMDAVASRIWHACGEQEPRWSAETLEPRLHIFDPFLSEGFFAHVAVLVEGDDDRAAILGAAAASGRDFEANGIGVLPVGGKNNLDRPLCIYSDLGIPCYPVWDCDFGKGNSHEGINVEIFNLLGEDPSNPYRETIGPSFTCFKYNLEDKLREELGEEYYDRIVSESMDFLGFIKKRQAIKNPILFLTLLERADRDGKSVTSLEKLVTHVWKLRYPD